MKSTILALQIGVCGLLLTGCGTMDPVSPASSAGEVERLREVREIKDLSAVPETLLAMKGRVLVVFDIDDTLLTSARFYGSDKWYEWQKGLADEDPGKVPCKFDVIALNYEAGTQVATQSDGPAIVDAITVDKIFLTARNPLYRGGTVRELLHAGYRLPQSATEDGISYRWSADSAKAPVTVSFDQGLFMVSGQDKGVLLLDLLSKKHLSYDAVVLIDDGKKNIDAMQVALNAANVSYTGLWYTRIDKSISPDEAAAGRAGWAAMKAFLGKVFPERATRFSANECFN